MSPNDRNKNRNSGGMPEVSVMRPADAQDRRIADVGREYTGLYRNAPQGQTAAPAQVPNIPSIGQMLSDRGQGLQRQNSRDASGIRMRANSIREQLADLDNRIMKGINGTHGYGKLTAPGLQALVGLRNSQQGELEELIGASTSRDNTIANLLAGLTESGARSATDLNRQQMGDRASLARQGLANQGNLEATSLRGVLESIIQGQRDAAAGARTNATVQGNLDLEALRQRDPLRTEQARASRQLRGEVDLPVIDYEARFGPGTSAAAIQPYIDAQDTVSITLNQVGGDVREALTSIMNDAEAERSEFGETERWKRLELAKQNLVERYLNNNPVGRAYMNSMQDDESYVVPFAEGGLVQGGEPAMGLVQQYQDYVTKAREMSLPPVQLEEFASMIMAGRGGQAPAPTPQMQPNGATAAQPGVIGYAEGGMVGEQVDEKLVIDPNPNAPTDSIPAVVDGQQPAALDSGEFVLPKDVVMFYGTEKLQKLIEKARNPQGKPAAGQGMVSQGLMAGG